MRCAAVKLSMMQREKRWDPVHYLRGIDPEKDDIARAKLQINLRQ